MRRSSKNIDSPVFVNINSCDGCGKCVEICPAQVFEAKELTDREIDNLPFFGRLKVRIKGKTKSEAVRPDHCIACGKCIKSCHEHAIKVRDFRQRA